MKGDRAGVSSPDHGLQDPTKPPRGGIPVDPLGAFSIAEFGRQLRSGEMTSEEVTRSYLKRIAALDDVLGAFEHVAADAALAAARAFDSLLSCGTDLGPLMGVPIAVKDIFVVSGMPTTAGSAVDVSDLLGDEGPFVQSLRRAGCVILGKTKTVEFAFGAVGTNSVRGTPRNPWDAGLARAPGGSSSGSAVAVAAGLCAFAIGSDTGGSVRLPAALCGIVGLKTTVGLWSTEGVFPLAPTFDSIGLLTRSATDASAVFSALSGERIAQPASLETLRLGKPAAYLLDDLDPEVAHRFADSLALLERAGTRVVSRDMRGVAEREAIFPTVLASELLASLGTARFKAESGAMDPVVAARIARGLETSAHDYLRAIRRHEELKDSGVADLADLDGWIAPTAALLPPPIADFSNVDTGLRLASTITRNSQPMNLFGQCGITLPIQARDAALPIGLQITCGAGEERKALSIALALELLTGRPRLPDMSEFTSPS